jgi:hypothetical protein
MARKIALILASVLLLAGFTLFILEKTHVINIYHKSIAQESNVKPVNTVDYSPATANDNANNDQIKQNSLNDTPQVRPLTVTITRATQDPSSKTLIIRALVDGTTSGSCTLELSRGSGAELTKQASVIQQNNTYTCGGFNISQSELPGVGEWTVKLSVSNGSTTASANQNIMIEK